MDPLSLVLSALSAGAAFTAKAIGEHVLKDVYEKLKSEIVSRSAEPKVAETVLGQYESDPDTWEKPTRKLVADSGAANNAEVVRLAQQIVNQTGQSASADGYRVTFQGNVTNAAIGHHASIVQTPADPDVTKR